MPRTSSSSPARLALFLLSHGTEMPVSLAENLAMTGKKMLLTGAGMLLLTSGVCIPAAMAGFEWTPPARGEKSAPAASSAPSMPAPIDPDAARYQNLPGMPDVSERQSRSYGADGRTAPPSYPHMDREEPRYQRVYSAQENPDQQKANMHKDVYSQQGRDHAVATQPASAPFPQEPSLESNSGSQQMNIQEKQEESRFLTGPFLADVAEEELPPPAIASPARQKTPASPQSAVGKSPSKKQGAPVPLTRATAQEGTTGTETSSPAGVSRTPPKPGRSAMFDKDSEDNALENAEKETQSSPVQLPQGMPATGRHMTEPRHTQTRHTDDYPQNVETVSGFGNDIPLTLAVRQLVPSSYDVSFDKVEPDAIVSWQGGRPWNVALEDVLRTVGAGAVIKGDTIHIQPYKGGERIHHATSDFSASAMGGRSSEADKMMTGGHASLPQDSVSNGPGGHNNRAADAAHTPAGAFSEREKSSAAGVISDRHNASAGRINPNRQKQVRPDSSQPSPSTRTGPENVSALEDGQWAAAPGERISDVVREWSGRAGTELFWNAEQDYVLESAYRTDGNLKQAVTSLLNDATGDPDLLSVQLSPNLPDGPAVLVVRTNSRNGDM